MPISYCAPGGTVDLLLELELPRLLASSIRRTLQSANSTYLKSHHPGGRTTDILARVEVACPGRAGSRSPRDGWKCPPGTPHMSPSQMPRQSNDLLTHRGRRLPPVASFSGASWWDAGGPPDLPSSCSSLRDLDCAHFNSEIQRNPGLIRIVTASPCRDWAICAPAAFLGCAASVLAGPG